ncbi:MAG TPA: sugar ABC transporter substrate-binding protein [Casimicrobiaceae bacterium]|nr:sugar ABC transporter substrate-binding protein [Casimicrobiaceae bacterium]
MAMHTLRRPLRFAAQIGLLAVAAILLALATPAAAEQKKLSFLTWNISDQADLFKEWIAEFKKRHPDVDVEWLDKKGPELPAFYQTQVIAGTPPDIINTQGALWLEYAAGGGLVDLTPYLDKDPDVRKRFNADYLAQWKYKGRNYMLPFYISKTLLFYNKTMFKEAGIPGPPQSFDELLVDAKKMSKGEKTGFITLNFDWLYWPLFRMNGVDLLTPDLRKAAFDTPKGVQVLDALAKATNDGSINKIAWTGRWVEPNGAFASGNVGMLLAHSPAFFFIRGQAPWVNADTLGVAQAPGGWATPNSHGLGISKGSKHPELAWEFLKMVTSEDWTSKLSERRKVLTGNIASDKKLLDQLGKDDPLAAAVLQTQVEDTNKLTGNWPLANDARVKEAFYPEIQNAVLGRKPAAQALKDAEAKVDRVLGQ